jgi:DNA-binding Xre family transcriptional regulator
MIRWRVESLLTERGWSVAQLANIARLDPKTVRGIVDGRASRVDLTTLARLADALAVEPGALFDRGPREGDERWNRTAGAAGAADAGEMAAVLGGDWTDDDTPALERAARP